MLEHEHCHLKHNVNCLVCFKSRYPCSNSGNSYVLDFGERFCEMFVYHASRFTHQGLAWVDAVRKCLQVELVPLFRPYEKSMCDSIKKKALISHSSCYVEPYEEAPTMCDINFRDWLQVVATVKYSLDWRLWNLGVLQQNTEIISEGLEKFLTCQKDELNVTTIKISFQTKPHTYFINSVFGVMNQLQDLIKQNFATDDLLVYPYIPDTNQTNRATEYTGDIDVHIMVAQRSEFDLNFQQGKIIDIAEAVDYFLDKGSVGEFHPNLAEGVELKTYTVCNEVRCQSTNRTVEQPVFYSADGNIHCKNIVTVTLLVLFTFLII